MYNRDAPSLSKNNRNVNVSDLYKPADGLSTTNSFADWIYEDNYDQAKLSQFETLYHIPGIRDYMDYLLDFRADQEYLNRYQMSLSDVHDPRKLHQVSSGSRTIGFGINFVSSNVKRLYR